MRAFTKEKDSDGSTGFWAWSSTIECCRAGELGLLSEGWEGAETFYIVADDILTPHDDHTDKALDLLKERWDPLRYGVVD